MKPSLKSILAAVALVSCAASYASATVIYSHVFDGSAAQSLNGLAPTVDNSGDSVSWTGGTGTNYIRQDGSVGTASQGASVYLPIELEVSSTYQLTMDFLLSSGSGWAGFGFSNTVGTTSGLYYTGSTVEEWAVFRTTGGADAFKDKNPATSNSGTNIGALAANTITTGDMRAVATLTTGVTLAESTLTITVWNVSTPSITYTLLNAYPVDASTYNFLALTASSAAPIQFQSMSFSLIPEPSAFALLLGLGALGGAALRRRRVR